MTQELGHLLALPDTYTDRSGDHSGSWMLNPYALELAKLTAEDKRSIRFVWDNLTGMTDKTCPSGYRIKSESRYGANCVLIDPQDKHKSCER